MTLMVVQTLLAVLVILLGLCSIWFSRKASWHAARAMKAAQESTDAVSRLKEIQRQSRLPNKITWTKADFVEMEKITRPPPMGKPSHD